MTEPTQAQIEAAASVIAAQTWSYAWKGLDDRDRSAEVDDLIYAHGMKFVGGKPGFRRVARAAIAAAEAAAWQPISTAPRDGTHFLSWNGYRVEECWWVATVESSHWSAWKPTHWRPLPAPPITPPETRST